MRICLHKFVALFLVFGLIAGSLPLVSSIRVNAASLGLTNVSGGVEAQISPNDLGQTCDPMAQMANCTMTHPSRVSMGMGCCGCLLSLAATLCIAPPESRINAFNLSDVTGNSRTPKSLLKPPRA
jgi:hypothetical protein